MANFDFGLKKPKDTANYNLFTATDPENTKPYEIINIQLDKLVPFANHPFKLYEGQRFDDMCESIKENGVLLPIIIRPADGDDNYEILSGHNRAEAAKAAGLEFIPAIIRENLTDEEAMFIVTETNLIQRSFTDLTHSERAVTLAMHYEATKSQGKRINAVNEIENLLNNDANANADFEQSANNLSSRDKTAQEYSLSKDTVARYLRVNKLIEPLKNRLDNKEFGLVPAVEISYLSDDEQDNLNMILDSPMYKLDMKKAAQLREFSEKKKLTAEKIEEILAGFAKKKSNINKTQKLTLKPNFLSRYFTNQENPEEMEAEIAAALDFYRENKTKFEKQLEETTEGDDENGEEYPRNDED